MRTLHRCPVCRRPFSTRGTLQRHRLDMGHLPVQGLQPRPEPGDIECRQCHARVDRRDKRNDLCGACSFLAMPAGLFRGER